MPISGSVPSTTVPTQRAPTAFPRRKNPLRSAVARWLMRYGVLQRVFRRQAALRILSYHGVYADELLSGGGAPAGSKSAEPGTLVPSYFVGVTAFARQMELLRNYGPVVRLADVADQIAAGQFRGPAIAITFDDVAACTFVHAAPVLARLGFPATFFVATGHVSAGRLFDADVIRILRARPELIDADLRDLLAWVLRERGLSKRMPHEQLRAPLAEAERQVRGRLEPAVVEALRPVNWDEVARLAAAGHEIAAHTVDHVNLGWESAGVRRRQIVESVAAIASHLGQPPVGFAYPISARTNGAGRGSQHGGPDDYGREDIGVLRDSGLRYAVTTRPGFVGRHDSASGVDPDVARFELPRAGIGAGHTPELFAIDLAGVLDRRRRRRQGWR